MTPGHRASTDPDRRAPAAREPRVLQFGDASNVALTAVKEACARGWDWRYLGPEKVRPTGERPGPARRTRPEGPGDAPTAARLPAAVRSRAIWLPYVARHVLAVGRAEVVHVHGAHTVHLLRPPVPRRPYVLTLHGSDIRRQWHDPAAHDRIQRAIDGAAHVLWVNTDNTEDVLTARPDAEYLPSLVDVAALPAWSPGPRPVVLFASRWDEDKTYRRNVELARALRPLLPADAEMVGIDWGPGAPEAAAAGVRLLPRMERSAYLAALASAHVVIGQASDYFSTSEFEALCIGAPMAAVGSRLPRPDDGTRPPVMEGEVAEVAEQIRAALADPRAAAARLDPAGWARPRYAASAYVGRLQEIYREVAGR